MTNNSYAAAGSRPGKGSGTFSAVLVLIVLLGLLGVITLVSMLRGGSVQNQALPENSVIVNEIMASNDSFWTDGDSEYSDWIELYNNGRNPVNLGGYYLSDSFSDPYKWAVPEITVNPGEYLIFFASGKDECDKSGYYHTNFRLSSDGESVVLTSPERMDASSLEYGVSIKNISFGRVLLEDGTYGYRWLDTATPGKENSTVYALNAYELPASVSGIVINEVMTDNTYTVYDRDGDYNDWVELHNTSSKDVSLDGCALSDNPDDPMRWLFPDGTVVEPGGYLLIHLSGKDRYGDGELHTSFALSSRDTALVLSDSMSRRIDYLELPALKQNISFGLSSDGSKKFFSMPTPGSENYSVSFEQLSAAGSAQNRLVINEVSAASVEDLTGAALDDWIEIFNGTGSDINLSGYGLSNNVEERFRFSFGNVTLASGGYMVIPCTGEKAVAGEAPFKIDCSGEDLYLCDSKGNVIDTFDTGKLRIGISSGKAPDGTRLYYPVPTKGAENTGTGYSSYVSAPVFSSQGGYVSSGYTLKVTAPAGTVVRYTTDGSTPTEQSTVLDGSLRIEKSITIKARAFSDSAMPSDTTFATFLVEKEHTVPVVCISSAEEGLFSRETGIYESTRIEGDPYPFVQSNFWQDWERETTVEYFVDGVKQISFTAGAKIFGQFTRVYKQKSFALHIRDIYGASSVSYPFFDNGLTEYSALVLRASGQDLRYARMRDAYVCKLVKSGSDSLVAADSQPVAVYVNGEYYGLYNLREKINEDYLERYEGIKKSSLDIIKGNKNATCGTTEEFNELREYLRKHSMKNDEYYDYVCSQVDLESCIDFTVYMAFAINNDPYNLKIFKDNTGNSKWRWILFDFDMSLRNANHQGSIKYALEYNFFCAKLLENEEFRQMFIERFAYHLNNTFLPENTTALWQSMANEISGEIDRQYERWTFPEPDAWQSAVNFVDKLLQSRRDMLKKQLINYFSLSKSEVAALFPNG